MDRMAYLCLLSLLLLVCYHEYGAEAQQDVCEDGCCTVYPANVSSGCIGCNYGVTVICNGLCVNASVLNVNCSKNFPDDTLSIIIESNNFAEVEANVFANLSSLQFLVLNYNNNLTTLPENLFSAATALQQVVLNFNSLQFLPPTLFWYLTSLVYLDLDSNNLSFLSNQSFIYLFSLQQLYLNNNQLTSLPSGIFDNLISLQLLHLNYNRLTFIQANAFWNLTYLHQVTLNSNNLTTLPVGIFSDASFYYLQILYLSNNNFVSWPADLFASLPNLQVLFLSNCNLSEVPGALTSFAALKSLETIDLSHNKLTILPEDIFYNKRYFQILQASYNLLTTLPAGLFAQSSDLQVLYFDHNLLASIPIQVFSNVPALQTITLAYNQLTEIPVFGYGTQLIFLDVSNNLIADLNGTSLVRSLNLTTFGATQAIAWQRFYYGLFTALDSLFAFNISNNPALQHLETDLLPFLSAQLDVQIVNENDSTKLMFGSCCGKEFLYSSRYQYPNGSLLCNNSASFFNSTANGISIIAHNSSEVFCSCLIATNWASNSNCATVTPELLLQDECVSSCPPGYRISPTLPLQLASQPQQCINANYNPTTAFDMKCVKCLYDQCAVCDNNVVFCSQCMAGLFLYNQISLSGVVSLSDPCYERCPNGTRSFNSSNAVPSCQQCLVPNCLTCDSSLFTCDACIQGLIVVNGNQCKPPQTILSSSAIVNIKAIVAGSTTAAVVVMFGFFLYWRYKRTSLRKVQYDLTTEKQFASELHQKLIDTEIEVLELKQSWQIPAKDLNMLFEISSGAFGEVYVASWGELQVAVKRLKGAILQSSDSATEEFNREVEFMMRCRCPNVVFFYGAGVFANGTPFLVTELCKFGSLRTLIAGNRLSQEDVLPFALQIARGLAYIHSLNAVHRDVKTGNVLIASVPTSSDRNVVVAKVADFGTSRACCSLLKAAGNVTTQLDFEISAEGGLDGLNMTQAVGTLVYMAPEVLLGKDYDHRSDVYSYGCVLYEMVHQEVPWNDVKNNFLGNELCRRFNLHETLEITKPSALTNIGNTCLSVQSSARPEFKEIISQLTLLQQ